MASQKTWGYQEAYDDFYKTDRIMQKTGLDKFFAAGGVMPGMNDAVSDAGGGQAYTPGVHMGRTWEDVLRDNAVAMYGQQAANWTPQQWEQVARQRGLLGAKETSWGEDIMEGLQGPLALPAMFAGGLAMQGMGGAGAGMDPALAGGGEVGSGYAASAPGATGGNFMGGNMSFANAGVSDALPGTDMFYGDMNNYAGGDWGMDLSGMENLGDGGAMDMFGSQAYPGGGSGDIFQNYLPQGEYQIPWGKVAGAGLSLFGSIQNQNMNSDLMNQIMNSDMWRSQQPRYFQPVYDAATKGVGNTAYGQSIAKDTAKTMAAMGYNMSGNQMGEVAQSLNKGSMDYVRTVGNLAMGRPADTGAIAQVGRQGQQNNNDMWGNVGYGLDQILTGKQPNSFQQMMGQQPNKTLTESWSL